MADDTCSVETCDKKISHRGRKLCSGHNHRFKKCGDVKADEPLREDRRELAVPVGTVCSADDCDRTDIESRLLCTVHYGRWLRHGSLENLRGKTPRNRPPKPRVPCSVSGCVRHGQPMNKDGRCSIHQLRWTIDGDVGSPEIRRTKRHKPGQLCAVDDCDLRAVARDWCAKHWTRWYNYGDPLAHKRHIWSGVRTCAGCFRTPNQVHFRSSVSPGSKSPDGLQSRCEPCARARQHAYQSALSPTDPIRLRGYELTRLWRERNPEQVRQYGIAWRKANRDSTHASAERRRRRLRGQLGHIPTLNRRRIWETFCGLCGLCAKPVLFEDMHVDHIKPVSKGGSHSYTNVQPSHRRCNLRKLSKEVGPWAFATIGDRRRADQLLSTRPRPEIKFVNETLPLSF